MKIASRRTYWKHGVFALAFLAAACFLLWKCRYGFGNVDESFYLTVPYRLWMGDGLFSQEWHLSQMAGILLLPFMWVFMLFSGGSTEGILLAFRYFYTAVQAGAALFLYLRLKKYTWSGAALASIVFFLYAPFGIMAMSYNSLGILCLTVAVVALMTNERRNRALYTAAGLFFAGAVLCCPYLAAGYFLYSLAVLVNRLLKRHRCGWQVLSVKCWLWLTCGIAGLAAVFCVFVLSRASVATILDAFPWIMNDPEHASRSFTSLLSSYWRSFTRLNESWILILHGYVALWLLPLLDKKGRVPRCVPFLLGAVLTAVLMLPSLITTPYINRVMFPLNVFALLCCLLSKQKLTRQLLFTVWLPGIFYSFCIHMASNQTYLAISSAMTVSLVGSIPIIVLTARELTAPLKQKAWKALSVGILACLMALQVGGLAYLRYTSVFWEVSMEAQTEQMETGPEKGLLVTPYKKQLYEALLEDTAAFRETEKTESVLYLSEYTWLYLASEGVEMSPYSAWLAGVNANTVARLTAYYEINPHKLPETVYAEAKYADFARELCGQYDYQMRTTPLGNLIFTRNS